MMPPLVTYEDVAISSLEFDARISGWADVPRQLLVDWLALLSKVARVVAPDYSPPALPDPIEYAKETIASDGPYGSSENFYYLSYFSIELAGLRLSFEHGRQEGCEPLGMETTGLPYNVTSYLAADHHGTAKARFFVWHNEAEAQALQAILGVAPSP